MKEHRRIQAILVYVGLGQSTLEIEQDLAEFHSLIVAAEIAMLEEIVCKRVLLSSKFLIGKGKLAEINERVGVLKPALVIFSHTLSPVQERNLATELKLEVWDRTQLILNIFHRRARSAEGKLQVELARLVHLSTRLVGGWTHLERQRGGIGVRGGPGETQLEADRRVLRQKVAGLKRRLEKLENQRRQNRRARQRSLTPTIALVGYTNAGKSTLFNRLLAGMKASVSPVENMLFTTLDPLLRKIYIQGFGYIILADTVGFIRELPHELVEAFHATLEEVTNADLLLHVIDASDSDKRSKIAVVNEVLAQIGASAVPQLEVLNKIDLMDDFSERMDIGPDLQPRRVWLSAEKNLGIDLLIATIFKVLAPVRPGHHPQGSLSLE